MMKFETWNRETLINEIKTAMPLAYSLAMGNFMGLPMKPKIYSEKELLQKTDYELRSVYAQLKHYDKDFRMIELIVIIKLFYFYHLKFM